MSFDPDLGRNVTQKRPRVKRIPVFLFYFIFFFFENDKINKTKVDRRMELENSVRPSIRRQGRMKNEPIKRRAGICWSTARKFKIVWFESDDGPEG